MPDDETSVRIPIAGTSTTLSAKVVRNASSPVLVIATHPWGPLGGSLHDPHPATACQLFARAGCNTVRFDFRSGIGRGASSIADTVAVAQYFTDTSAETGDGAAAIPVSQVLIVGYSYGSLVGAAAAAQIPQSVGFVCVGPPLGYAWALFLFNGGGVEAQACESAGKPKLLLIGDGDQFCSVSSCRRFAQKLPKPVKMQVVGDCDHFGLFPHLEKALAQWVPKAFPGAELHSFGRGVDAQAPAAVAALATPDTDTRHA